MKTIYCVFLFLTFNIIFSSCNRFKENDFQGDWIINKITYKGADVKLKSTGFRITMLPVPYVDKSVLSFNSDHSVQFPGINTKDIPCIWSVKNDTLKCVLNTAEFNSLLLDSIKDIKKQAILKHDTMLLKKYQYKKDSILNSESTKELKNATLVYIGDYEVEKTSKGLLLKSKYTDMELINMDKADKSVVDNLFKGL